jgi:hypothetical protein
MSNSMTEKTMINARDVLVTVLVLGVCGCASVSSMPRHESTAGDGSNSDAAWAQFDTDNDGYLTFDELTRQHAVGLQRDFSNADTNNDGKISRAEWNGWWPVMTKTEPAQSLEALNASSAPTNGIRAR